MRSSPTWTMRAASSACCTAWAVSSPWIISGSRVGSFSNLKNLPMDFLKIDGSFMRNLARDSVNQAMVTAMIKLARSLHFKVIAEQVEDDDAVDAARGWESTSCRVTRSADRSPGARCLRTGSVRTRARTCGAGFKSLTAEQPQLPDVLAGLP